MLDILLKTHVAPFRKWWSYLQPERLQHSLEGLKNIHGFGQHTSLCLMCQRGRPQMGIAFRCTILMVSCRLLPYLLLVLVLVQVFPSARES